MSKVVSLSAFRGRQAEENRRGDREGRIPSAPGISNGFRERLEDVLRGTPLSDLAAGSRMTRLLNATQGQFSPSVLNRDLALVRGYDDDTLNRLAFESTETEWMAKPTFYRAVMMVARERHEGKRRKFLEGVGSEGVGSSEGDENQ